MFKHRPLPLIFFHLVKHVSLNDLANHRECQGRMIGSSLLVHHLHDICSSARKAVAGKQASPVPTPSESFPVYFLIIKWHLWRSKCSCTYMEKKCNQAKHDDFIQTIFWLKKGCFYGIGFLASKASQIPFYNLYFLVQILGSSNCLHPMAVSVFQCNM